MVGIPRQNATQQIHYLRKGFVFGDAGKVLIVGTIPAGALILKPLSGIHIVTVFNAGTNNRADIGYGINTNADAADDDYFGTDLSLLAATFVPLDEAVGAYRVPYAVDITCTPDITGTAATTGDAEIVIAYIPDNDG